MITVYQFLVKIERDMRMDKMRQLINDKYDNHVMPFLWMHGEEEATIRKYIEKIHQSGIGSVCIESRPHEGFLQEQWWQDVSIITEECERFGMTVWILDDKHFPTGYAAGEIKKNHSHLQKEFLNFTKLDFVGPKKKAGVMLDWLVSKKRPSILGSEIVDEKPDFSSEIVAIIAAKNTGFKEIAEETLLNLTPYIQKKTLYWDIPEGEWSIYVFFTTQEGGEAATAGYLNPLVPEATDILIHTVYESHFQHFGEKFGTVIEGFFSDEPRFGNIKGPNAQIGQVDMPLPWVTGLEEKYAQQLGWTLEQTLQHLPLLYTGNSEKAHEMRYQYMEMVTNLYRENFTKRIGKWCTAHGVKYIGHLIEDNNAHSRLGYGAGHFFKAMAGQDMAGIDVVLHQLAPQQNNGYFNSFTSTGWDGEFFHYTLGKMGASLGNLDPKKQGRTMCEVFGAYGWAEGIKRMKWMVDHLLVRGVNYFVPHAFSMADFPDPDCPPHFFANGHNIQFPYFHYLMTYMNKIGTLFSGGQHQSEIAVLYNAEAEWSGESMTVQKVTRELTEKQFEFDIVSSEMVEESQIDSEGNFLINDHSFKVLIVPYAKRLPFKLIQKTVKLSEKDVVILFIDAFFSEASEQIEVHEEKSFLETNAQQVTLAELSEVLVKIAVDQLQTKEVHPYLRYFHYQQENKSIYMLFNENSYEKLQATVRFVNQNQICLYDTHMNRIEQLQENEGWYTLAFEPGEALILFENTEFSSLLPIERTRQISLKSNQWLIHFENEKMKKTLVEETLPILGVGDEFEDYAGTIIYETTFSGNKKKCNA